MKTCTKCASEFKITDTDKVFYSTLKVPEPTQCPDCRQQRRIAFRNDQYYYPGKCSQCQENIISMYSSDKHVKALCDKCYYSDTYDPLEYGQEYDFSKSFLEQFSALRRKVPHMAVFHSECEDSDYTVHSIKSKHCYDSSSLMNCENILYSDWVMNSKNSMDLYMCSDVENCYKCIHTHHATDSDHLDWCTEIENSSVCFNCHKSKNLIGCVNITGKENCILNEECTAEECEALIRILKINRPSFDEFILMFEALQKESPKRESWMMHSESCTGNYLYDSKRSYHSYNSRAIEDSKFAYECMECTNSYDVTRSSGTLLYECMSSENCDRSKFCNLTYNSEDMIYCHNCHESKHCFGCIALKGNSYCILNKQYSEEEYNALVPRIIEHMKTTKEWGEFFPITFSPFAYNETMAQEFYPLDQAKVTQYSWQWKDMNLHDFADVAKKIPVEDLPDDISKIPDEILERPVECRRTGNPFRITKEELDFYRKHRFPVPHTSPKERHKIRVNMQNERKLWKQKCYKCGKDIESTYNPKNDDIVYCSECY